MLKKRLLFFSLLAFIYGPNYAQNGQVVFSTDRPGNSCDTEVMPLHKIAWDKGCGIVWLIN